MENIQRMHSLRKFLPNPLRKNGVLKSSQMNGLPLQQRGMICIEIKEGCKTLGPEFSPQNSKKKTHHVLYVFLQPYHKKQQ